MFDSCNDTCPSSHTKTAMVSNVYYMCSGSVVSGHFKWLLTFSRQWPENGSSVHCLFYCDRYFTIFLWAYDICSLLSYVYQGAKVSLIKCKARDHLWKRIFYKSCPVNGLASCNSQDKHYCTLAVRWSLACFIFCSTQITIDGCILTTLDAVIIQDKCRQESSWLIHFTVVI